MVVTVITPATIPVVFINSINVGFNYQLSNTSTTMRKLDLNILFPTKMKITCTNNKSVAPSSSGVGDANTTTTKFN